MAHLNKNRESARIESEQFAAQSSGKKSFGKKGGASKKRV